MVIEGYPRSGNSFALAAWQQAHGEDRPLAHHLHVAAQAVRAYHLGVPSLILIRDPIDAIASNIVRGPHLHISDALKDYIAFYSTILTLPAEALFLAAFEEVVTDFGAVGEAVNTKFSTSFKVFEHSDDNVSACFEAMDHWTVAKEGPDAVAEGSGAPSEQRKAKLEEVKARILEPHYDQLLGRAQRIRAEALQCFRPELKI